MLEHTTFIISLICVFLIKYYVDPLILKVKHMLYLWFTLIFFFSSIDFKLIVVKTNLPCLFLNDKVDI